MFSKGYKNDAGTEIILQNLTVFKAKQITVVNLHCQITPKPGTCAIITPRSSAARLGLFIATCPIDADYSGDVHAIVFNASDETIVYNAGESFCQFVTFKIDTDIVTPCKKTGQRSHGAFGSTDIK